MTEMARGRLRLRERNQREGWWSRCVHRGVFDMLEARNRGVG